MDKPIIVGIDPGTTTAIVCLDIHGNVVFSHSSRNMSRADIIRVVSSAGKPFIIASDIHPPPKKVGKIASAFSAMLVYPEENPRRKEKGSRIKKADMKIRPRGSHQKDALSAALYAYKRIRPEINKIEQEMRSMGIKVPIEPVVERVVGRREKIKSAIMGLKHAGERAVMKAVKAK